MFGPFPKSDTVISDKVFIEKWNSQFAGEFVTKEELEASFAHKDIKNIQLIKGDIRETLPKFLNDNPAFRIALLHIDTDVYEPCKATLELCWDRIVSGGIIVFDDYATIEGETTAVDEFFKGRPHKFHKFPFSHEKPSFMIKE